MLNTSQGWISVRPISPFHKKIMKLDQPHNRPCIRIDMAIEVVGAAIYFEKLNLNFWRIVNILTTDLLHSFNAVTHETNGKGT